MPVSLTDYTIVPHSPVEQLRYRAPIDQRQQKVPTILVISDDKDLRMLLVECLQTLTYTAVGAAHGAQALACLDQYPIHHVILDFPLSPQSNTTTYAEIREHTDDAEIVALSPSTQQTIQRQTPGRGADWYIQKPFRLADLQSALQSLQARGQRVKLAKN